MANFGKKEKKSAIQVVADAVADVMVRDNRVLWDPHRWVLGDPMNWKARTPYKGRNRALLSLVAEESAEFATFNQVNEAKGKVKKRPENWEGPWGFPVIKWIPWNFSQHRAWKDTDNEKKDKKGMLSKYYTVFEVGRQTEGIEPRRETVPKGHTIELVDEAEEFVKTFCQKTNLKFTRSAGTPCYSPVRHEIKVPEPRFFKSVSGYYETTFHELVHSTMGAMKRESASALMGRRVYSAEEIVAECGSALLSVHFGFVNEPKDMSNQAEYIKGWSKAIRENPNWLQKGLKEAEKAVSYMLKTAGIEVEEPVDDSTDAPAAAGTVTDDTAPNAAA